MKMEDFFLQWEETLPQILESTQHSLCDKLWQLLCICIEDMQSKACLTHLPPGQNGHKSADDIFQCISMNEKVQSTTQISQKFVPKGPIDNKSA